MRQDKKEQICSIKLAKRKINQGLNKYLGYWKYANLVPTLDKHILRNIKNNYLYSKIVLYKASFALIQASKTFRFFFIM